MAYTIKQTFINLGLVAAIALPGMASAEYVFTAPPRETAEAGKKLYGPLVDHLSGLLNEKVTYQHPGSWRNYKKDMQKGVYDIVFDGPHFAAWRMEKKQAYSAVKLPGQLSFVLVARKDKKVSDKKQLIGRKVCTLPSPNLGAMTVYSMYPNQMSQPVFTFVKGGFKKVTKQMFAGKCEASILRKSFYTKKLTPEQRDKLVVLETSKPYVNQGVTVNARIPASKRKLIIESLTKGEGRNAARPLFDRFSAKASSFVVADSKEYGELNLLKKNNMFGW
jgi:ABC-type phosphate/phosphonate transport system substrate-binding protein